MLMPEIDMDDAGGTLALEELVGLLLLLLTLLLIVLLLLLLLLLLLVAPGPR